MITALTDYYRMPRGCLNSLESGETQGDPGFFRFGTETVCYGHCASGVASSVQDSESHDARKDIRVEGAVTHLAFDPDEVIQNLQRERYEARLIPGRERMVTKEWVRKTYYALRDVLPDRLRRSLQRAYFSDWKSRPFPAWPVDFTVDRLHQGILALSMRAAGLSRVPFIWFWPHGAPNCMILTHDVETKVGRDFTRDLIRIDGSYGFKASFQVIPERRYQVTEEYVNEIRGPGFEFNIHDLGHDGQLYRDKDDFLHLARKINQYVRHYGARGFRAGAMYRVQDWYSAYEFSYDMSVPNVAHLEPRRGGCCTVFPYFVGRILELPLTTCQDYAIFHILKDYSIDLWKKQLELLHQSNGLISLLAHPDYLLEPRARKVYEAWLDYLRSWVGREGIWTALPGELDEWWRARNQMELAARGNEWEILGPQAERAQLAFAVLDGDRVVYELATVREGQKSER